MRESHKSINDLEYLHNMQCLNVHSDSAPVSDVQSSQQDRGLNWPVHINFRHVEVSNDEGRSKWGLSRGLSNSKYRRRQDREGFRQPHHHLKVFFYGLLIQGNFFCWNSVPLVSTGEQEFNKPVDKYMSPYSYFSCDLAQIKPSNSLFKEYQCINVSCIYHPRPKNL